MFIHEPSHATILFMNDHIIFETDHFTASQTTGYDIPGYVIVEFKGDSTQLADFTPEQSAELMHCLTRAESLVQMVIQPERIYIMKFGEVNTRVHFHVFPRTERIGKAFEEQGGDPPPYNGARLIGWIWEHHSSLGFTREEIQAFVRAARNLDSGD